MTDYILAYYQAICDGSVCVGKWIRIWYEMIVKGLEAGEYFYNPKKANLAISFIERFCRHHEGALAPQLIKLELWQKALIAVLFGIVDDTGARQFREAMVIIGRKNGKTLLAAGISAYMAYLDGEYGGQIYFAAPKLDQSRLCYHALCQMIAKEPSMDKKANVRKYDTYLPFNNTTIRPLSFSSKTSDGFNVSLAVLDEVASWSGDKGLKFYEVLKSSCGSRRQPLLLSISTAGYQNDSAYDELMKRCTAVLMGSSKESRLAPFLYIIDDLDKWDDINELRKSNPNLGVSISVSYLMEEIAIAQSSLSKAAEFKTKYANVKQSSSQAFLPFDVVKRATGDELRPEDFRHSYAVGGIDLSQTTDLTSACVIIERGGHLHILSHFWMPAARLETATAEDGVPYDIFRQQGLLSLSGENYVDYKDCIAWYQTLVRQYEIMPLKVGYDRYSAQYMVGEMRQLGYHMDDVFQGTNLSSTILYLDGAIRDGIVHIGNNNLLMAHFLNSAIKTDDYQKRRLVKVGNRKRIDGMAAVLDALAVRSKYYPEIGLQLKNEVRR